MSADHMDNRGGRRSVSSSVLGVTNGNSGLEDSHAYLQSGPSLSNVDRGKKDDWCIVNKKGSTDAGKSTAVSDKSGSKIPSAYEGAADYQGHPAGPYDFDNDGLGIGAHIDETDTNFVHEELKLETEEGADMTAAERKEDGKFK